MENSEKSQNRGLSEVVIKDLRILASSFCILLFLVGINSIFQNLFAVKESVSEVVIPRPLSSQEITHGDQTKNQVIFTFDGGSGSESGKAILDTYKKHNIKATFFLTGKFVEENPELVRSMVAGGHEIFNHTYDHPHLDEISDQEIIVEFEKMDQVLTRTVGISSKPFFRPPYGSRDQRVLDIAYKAGYQSVYWSIDAGDWEESNGTTPDQVKYRILSNLTSGNIYLMHIGDTITATILDDVFNTIESKGYKIVSLSEGL